MGLFVNVHGICGLKYTCHSEAVCKNSNRSLALFFFFNLLSRDPKIAHLLLQAQYPVLGVDCYMPVIDVFSGSCKGNLRVVLAMGGSEQIVALQRSRDEECDYFSHLVKPVHLLDHQRYSPTKVSVVFFLLNNACSFSFVFCA